MISAVARGESVARLRSSGLRVVRDDHEEVVAGFPVFDCIQSLPRHDYLFLCTKAMDNFEIVRSLSGSANASATLVPLQNGLDPAAELRAQGHRGRVLDAVLWASSHLLEPATVSILGWPKILLGCISMQDRSQVTKAFSGSAISLRIQEVPLERQRWLKFGFVLAISVATAMYPGPCVSVLEDSAAGEMFSGLVNEFGEFSAQRGMVGNPDEFKAYCFRLIRSMPPGNVASMAADILAGRPGELVIFLDDLLARAGNLNLKQFAMARARLRAELGV
jgi:2-dehydropantoate 2-reductase